MNGAGRRVEDSARVAVREIDLDDIVKDGGYLMLHGNVSPHAASEIYRRLQISAMTMTQAWRGYTFDSVAPNSFHPSLFSSFSLQFYIFGFKRCEHGKI